MKFVFFQESHGRYRKYIKQEIVIMCIFLILFLVWDIHHVVRNIFSNCLRFRRKTNKSFTFSYDRTVRMLRGCSTIECMIRDGKSVVDLFHHNHSSITMQGKIDSYQRFFLSYMSSVNGSPRTKRIYEVRGISQNGNRYIFLHKRHNQVVL